MTTDYDILAIKGTSLVLRFQALDINSNPIDLTEFNASGVVRLNYSDTGFVLDLKPTVSSGFASGFIDINLAATGLNNLPITQALYDIKIYNSSGYVTQVAMGHFNVMPAATF